MRQALSLYILAVFSILSAIAPLPLFAKQAGPKQAPHQELTMFKTPYTPLLETTFFVSSKEIAETVLSNPENYLPTYDEQKLIEILERRPSKNLRFKFMDIAIEKHEVKARNGQYEISITHRISVSPELKDAATASQYIKKYISTRPNVIFLVLQLTNPSAPPREKEKQK